MVFLINLILSFPSSTIDFLHKIDLAIATLKNVLNIALLKERLNQKGMEKAG